MLRPNVTTTETNPRNTTAPSSADAAARWHALDAAAALDRLDATRQGLPEDEARARLERFGRNELPPPARRSILRRLAEQFHNVLIYVLLGAAAVTALMAHWVDTGVILGVVAVNAMIGFIQEGKAERAIDAIRNVLSLHATVLRRGKRVQVEAASLVPGDVVHLQSGDKVPADLRLFHVKNLRIDEALLTGESAPVDKTVEPSPDEAVLGDQLGMAFSGTLVTYGQGTGVVVATGAHTQIGRISGMLNEVQAITTKLLRQIATFGRWLTAAIIVLAAGTILFGTFFRDYSLGDMFIAGVGLAVAAIPEGLPAIVTITLAIGVQRMAKRGTIIRRLPAVETLGSVTVICSDKTGTLTRNEMTARTVVLPDHAVEVTGVGYDPAGDFQESDGRTLAPADEPALTELSRAATLCNEATLTRNGDGWQLTGDPTEGALVCLAMKAGIDPEALREQSPAVDTVPFESERRYMASLHRNGGDGAVVYVKGAPERVLEMCESQAAGDGESPLDRARWERTVEQLAGRGQRVLALARRHVASDAASVSHGDVEHGLTLIGLVGLIDPPRADAVEAVRQCREAGIRVKMITGDHAATARAIATEMGIGDGEHSMTGEEIAALDPAELRRRAHDVDVFARVSPEHKLRLVGALQEDGDIAAMTGDGVNDAPALKRADIGIAMGVKGTEVAKESSQMVLTDDNFASIAHAVEEGRTVYDNIRKALVFILPTNAAEAGLIITAIALGRTLPLTPLQILWVNMVTAVTLALALAFERAEPGVMKRPPRNPREPLLNGFLLWRIAFVGALLIAGTFGLFAWQRAQGASIELARTVAVNMLVVFEIVYLLNVRFLTGSVLSRDGILGSGYVLGAIAAVCGLQVVFTYAGPAQWLFETAAVGAGAWLAIVACAAAVFVIVELEKLAWRAWGGPR